MLSWANLTEEDVISDKMPSKNPHKDDVDDLAEFGIIAAPSKEPWNQGMDNREDMDGLDNESPYESDQEARDRLDQEAQDDLDQKAQHRREGGSQLSRHEPSSSSSSDLSSLAPEATLVPGNESTPRPIAIPDSGFQKFSQVNIFNVDNGHTLTATIAHNAAANPNRRRRIIPR